MIKIVNEQGKALFKLEDDATEPEQVYTLCSAHQKPDPECRICKSTFRVLKEGEEDAKI